MDDAPSAEVRPAMLRDIGLFGGMDDPTLELLAEKLEAIRIDTGETVIAEGDTATEMYVVLAGELEVVKEGRGGAEARVALFGPGDWFGEMAILDVQPRSASVRAVAPTLLVRMTAEDVDALLYRRDVKTYALLMMNIARELSRRLRVADGILSQFVTTMSDEYVHKTKKTSS